MKVLVWQWGRRGAGPRFAACLAEALYDRPGIEVALSLCRDAEILAGPTPPRCDLPVRTYRGMVSYVLRLVTIPLAVPFMIWKLLRLSPDLAICAMPGPLDLVMALALRFLRRRLIVVVHDADAHPGDGFPGQMYLQRLLCRTADGLAALCEPVSQRLREQRLAGTIRRPLIRFEHPPFGFGLSSRERPDGPRRLLFFGRLLPYKGLDLLAEALSRQQEPALEVLVVGSGPESRELDRLRACRGVRVENRWVPETEIADLLSWADALILPYREASQSGVAAAALAAGRPVIATRVGGLKEQLSGAPQGVFCEPDPDSLGRAINLWLETPALAIAPMDAAKAWRDAVTALLPAIGALIPGRPVRASMGLPALSGRREWRFK